MRKKILQKHVKFDCYVTNVIKLRIVKYSPSLHLRQVKMGKNQVKISKISIQ